MTIWRTSVDELMAIFRKSLLDLIPHLEAAHIPWREAESYDDWDAVAAALYEAIVLGSVRWGSPGPVNHLEFPQYDALLTDYSGLSRIEVECESSIPAGHTLVFTRFGTESRALDMARCVEIGSMGETLGKPPTSVPIEEAEFAVRVSRNQPPIRELRVEL